MQFVHRSVNMAFSDSGQKRVLVRESMDYAAACGAAVRGYPLNCRQGETVVAERPKRAGENPVA